MSTARDGDAVSVIIATRNAARFLGACLDSVLNQSDAPSEILVVDASSDDGTREIATSYSDVTLLTQQGSGLPNAWNQGIRAARGSLIAMIDADDVWAPHYLRDCGQALRAHPEALCALAKVRFLADPTDLPAGLRPELANAERLGHMPGSTVFRRSVFDRVGLFPEDLVIASDIEWFGRLRTHDISCVEVDAVGLIKHMHGDNLSLDRGLADTYARELLTIARARARGAASARIPEHDRASTVRLSLGIRHVELTDRALLFDPAQGRAFVLTGRAQRLLSALASGIVTGALSEADQRVIARLRRDGLVTGPPDVDAPFEVDGDADVDVWECPEFPPLVLQDPIIDGRLVGQPLYVHVPDAARRVAIERLQVRAFAQRLFDTADAFTSKHAQRSLNVDIAGMTVRLRVPHDDIDRPIPLAEAFFDIAEEGPQAPAFEVTVIDGRGSDPASLATGFGPDWHFPLGLVSEDRAAPLRVAIDRHTQSVSVFSPDQRRCVVWMPRYAELPYWSAATPLRLQLSWVADIAGAEFVHAAGVRIGDGAVLLGGPSGSGKSTLALQLAGLGFDVMGDDFLVVRDSIVHGVYRRLKAHDWSAERLLPAGWRMLNARAVGEKRIIEADHGMTPGPLPIRAVVIPVRGATTALTPISAGEALSRIGPASLSGLLGGSPASLTRLSTLIGSHPCFLLTSNESTVADPEPLRALLEQFAS